MRILIHGAPPYAQSGYGVQNKFMCQALQSLGHEVAASMYAGVHEERSWNGVQLLSTGGKHVGNGMIAGNYKRWNADLVITLCDIFTLMPEQFEGMTVFPWVPVDVDPIGIMDREWLRIVGKIADLHPIAMSRHAQKMMTDAGIDSHYVPFATDFTPDEELGQQWRADKSIPPEMFLVVKIGVNNEDDRKAYAVTEQAFARFSLKQKVKTGLYMHCEAQAKKAPNLVHMAAGLKLQNRVAFCDEYLRGCDLYGDEYLRGMYNAADVLDAVSKGEGFGVPIIEALACGTPVITSRNSACTEKIEPSYGWLVSGQGEWANHHQSWWQTPSITDLERAYYKAQAGARGMRKAAARAGARWNLEAMTRAFKKILH